MGGVCLVFVEMAGLTSKHLVKHDFRLLLHLLRTNGVCFLTTRVALPAVPVHRESPGQSWCVWGRKGSGPARRGVRRWKPGCH